MVDVAVDGTNSLSTQMNSPASMRKILTEPSGIVTESQGASFDIWSNARSGVAEPLSILTFLLENQ